MPCRVVLCVFNKDEESQNLFSQFLSELGDVECYLDDVEGFPFVVKVKIDWDFTNKPLYEVLEFSTEMDLSIQIEVYPDGLEFDVIGSVDGDEEDSFVFEYSIYDTDFLSRLDAIDRVLLQFNLCQLEKVRPDEIKELGLDGIKKIADFFTAGYPYGTSTIFNDIPEAVKAAIYNGEYSQLEKKLST
jgi:hypothetical protein